MKIFGFIYILTIICAPLATYADTHTKPNQVVVEEDDVPINEDLMREHGVLNRCLLIYEEIANRLNQGQDFPLSAMIKTATIIREFLENHHEKMEEEFIFPRLERAGLLTDITATLREQHRVGHKITDFILGFADEKTFKVADHHEVLALYLRFYVRMFRPHEAREGTIVFPAFKNLVTEEEYKEIGEECERIEHELFGEDAFEKMVGTVENIEKQLGIYQLSQFTPDLQQ